MLMALGAPWERPALRQAAQPWPGLGKVVSRPQESKEDCQGTAWAGGEARTSSGPCLCTA